MNDGTMNDRYRENYVDFPMILLYDASKDRMVIMLVKYMSLMIPYFLEEIEWPAA